jgi:hypothetical protein
MFGIYAHIFKKFSLKRKKTYFKQTQFEKPCSKPKIIIMQANMFKTSILNKSTQQNVDHELKKFLFHIKIKIEP